MDLEGGSRGQSAAWMTANGIGYVGRQNCQHGVAIVASSDSPTRHWSRLGSARIIDRFGRGLLLPGSYWHLPRMAQQHLPESHELGGWQAPSGQPDSICGGAPQLGRVTLIVSHRVTGSGSAGNRPMQVQSPYGTYPGSQRGTTRPRLMAGGCSSQHCNSGTYNMANIEGQIVPLLLPTNLHAQRASSSA